MLTFILSGAIISGGALLFIIVYEMISHFIK